MFDHCWSCEKASLGVRILKRDVSFKISDVKICRRKLQFENVLLGFWEERGEKLMTCHLFLDNFWDFTTFGLFSKVYEFLKQNLVSRKLKYLNLDIMKCLSFLNSVFRKRRFIAENWLCFRACNSRIVTYDQEFCLVVWFLCFNHFYGIFFLKSFPSRNHGVVENMCSFSKSYL